MVKYFNDNKFHALLQYMQYKILEIHKIFEDF